MAWNRNEASSSSNAGWLDNFGSGLAGLFGPKFQGQYRCFPVSSIGRPELEIGNRIVLPPSAVQQLTRIQAPSPMLFEITDLDQRLRTHVGVLEFTAQEDTCYLPSWVLRRLCAAEGHILRVALKTLPKATFVRLRPASVALLRVYNPRALLESGLRNFVTLTAGDEFAVEYNTHLYEVEVVEVRPGDAACIIDADVEVEFATSKDAEAAAESLSRSAEAAAQSLSRSAEASERDGSTDPHEEPAAQSLSRSAEKSQKRPVLFSGVGQRPDGLPVTEAFYEDDIDGDMPWKSKRRIKGGVKYTTPPYGYDAAKFHGQSAANSTTANSVSVAAMPVDSDEAEVLGGRMQGVNASPVALKAQGLHAAQWREQLDAAEISKRRSAEEEEKRRQKMDEEKRRRQADELADKARRAAKPTPLTAPAQKRMVNGGASGGMRSAGATDSSGSSCCGCLRGPRPASATPNKV